MCQSCFRLEDGRRGYYTCPVGWQPSTSRRQRDIAFYELHPDDYEYAVRLESEGDAFWSYRRRGTSLSSSAAMQLLWSGVQLQLLATRHDAGEAIGLCTLYDVDHRNQRGFVAMIAEERYRGTGLGVKAMMAFIDVVFEQFPLRRLLFVSNEVALLQFASVFGRYLEPSVTMRDRIFIAGSYRDELIFGLDRHKWRSIGNQLAARSVADLAPTSVLEFGDMLATELGVQLLNTRPEALLDDVGFDSLARLELLMLLEDRAGHPLPDELAYGLRTVADAYHYWMATAPG